MVSRSHIAEPGLKPQSGPLTPRIMLVYNVKTRDIKDSFFIIRKFCYSNNSLEATPPPAPFLHSGIQWYFISSPCLRAASHSHYTCGPQNLGKKVHLKLNQSQVGLEGKEKILSCTAIFGEIQDCCSLQPVPLSSAVPCPRPLYLGW